ncbi:MAG: VOC family protein [Roseivirga sp.]
MSAIQNFQIPVTDFKRAHTFYNTLMGYELETLEYQGAQLAFFKCESKGGVSGSLIKSEGLTPSTSGTMVYLHAGDNMEPYLERASTTGANIIVQKTQLGPGMGFFAIFDDCEGNRVGLYSNN